MKTILILSRIFHKGKPFWEKQDSSIETAEISREKISKTVRKILPRKNQIKTPTRVIQLQGIPAQEIPVQREKHFTPGCLPAKRPRRLWPRIFPWSTKTSPGEMGIIVINSRDRKGKILLVNKEKMETMEGQGQGIILENPSKKKIETILRQVFLLIALQTTRVLKRNYRVVSMLLIYFVPTIWGLDLTKNTNPQI